MPTPIIHLCVADKLISMLDVGDRPSFVLGSIAPDSVFKVHTYKDVDGFDVQHNDTHFYDADYKVWRQNVREFVESKTKDRRFDFYLGWAVHVLTDICWNETLYKAFRAECEDVDMQKDDVRALYYRDSALLEANLCRQLRLSSSVLTYLDESVAQAGSDLLSYRNSVLDIFNAHPDEGVIKYFSVATVIGFVVNAATEISRLLGDARPVKKATTAKRVNQERETLFLEYLESQCVGAENAVSSKFLEAKFLCSGEGIRSMVNHLRCSCAPICSDRTGYWYAADDTELRATINQLRNRVRGILNAVTGLEVGLLTLSDDPFGEDADESAGDGE